mmetsp:Transcript_6531/g.17500  ORF Transcript_6531/g.17500 Transcript_6531/m.17500 type:complete len:151 (-) Transcript_6531:22-474(-)
MRLDNQWNHAERLSSTETSAADQHFHSRYVDTDCMTLTDATTLASYNLALNGRLDMTKVFNELRAIADLGVFRDVCHEKSIQTMPAESDAFQRTADDSALVVQHAACVPLVVRLHWSTICAPARRHMSSLQPIPELPADEVQAAGSKDAQ